MPIHPNLLDKHRVVPRQHRQGQGAVEHIASTAHLEEGPAPPTRASMLGNLEAQERCCIPWTATRRRLPHLSVHGVYQELEFAHPEERRSYG